MTYQAIEILMTQSQTAIVDASFMRSCPEDSSAIGLLVDRGYRIVLTDYLVPNFQRIHAKSMEFSANRGLEDFI
jgi:hypothetical protein